MAMAPACKAGFCGFDSRPRLQKGNSVYDEDAEFDKLVLMDVDDTLDRLIIEEVRLSSVRAGIHIDDSKELLQRYHITEPLREGMARLEQQLGDVKHKLELVQVRMVHAEFYMRDAPDVFAQEGGRVALFEAQLEAVRQMTQADELRDHLKAVSERAGPQPTELAVSRAAAQVEMYEKLGEQLVEAARLRSWFEKKKEEAAAAV